MPAQEDGFNEVFLGEDCWYAIRIQAKYIPQIKYIAGYVTAPTSAITHIAEVATITSYEGTGKYIVKFKGPAEKIGPIPLADAGIGATPIHEKIHVRKYAIEWVNSEQRSATNSPRDQSPKANALRRMKCKIPWPFGKN
ncbi:hypothetical protein [Dechloromonas sp. ZS-1]|uniref:hypothetical protein n=1 Tax=Dechloromonas sp. ZS-1 TaxID=3138067 RepID=UPI0031FD9C68